MRQLEEAGIYGNGLVPVDTKRLVLRYNECLEAAGVKPTALERFRIDGVGWSPEVAEEKGDPFYLSHGPANPLAVILTPDQRGKPVYISYFSFQRDLMDRYFRSHSRAIADLTAETGVWLDLDQGLSHYRNALDLLLIGDVTVHTHAVGGILEAWREQQELVQRFLSPGEAWFDRSLRQALLESARTHGDLRSRTFSIPEMVYPDTEVFYTKAFGGVYVFRGLGACEALIIFEEPAQMPEEPEGEGVRLHAIDDLRWFSLLLAEGVVEVDLDWHAANPERLNRTQECLLASVVCAAEPQVEYASLSMAQKKGFIQRLKGDMPELYFELEVLRRRMSGAGGVKREGLSLEVLAAASHPRLSMPRLVRDLVWQLLTRMRPIDFWRLYRHNKELFYALYPNWPESQRRWVVELVKRQIARRTED